MKIKLLTFFQCLIFGSLAPSIEAQALDSYVKTLKEQGKAPIEFIQEKLQQYDLILFDDALHSALDPFEFYQQLLAAEDNPINYVFLEVFGINAQPYLDAYFADEKKDEAHLLKVFQDNFGGYGWRYETYLDLLSGIWDLNEGLPEDKQIKVIGVDQPIYWEGIHTRADYNIFQQSLIGRDYFMYKTILNKMDGFKSGKKGIFLTNTRHAYKQIKNKKGELYWNCGTFFNQWHPGKTYSVRIHNVTLSIEARQETASQNTSMQGLERYIYSWIRMEDGKWDETFKQNGNRPVAFSLKNNVFGKASYVGNHMSDVTPGQTMYDAYDALIFLAPLEVLHFSAQTNFFYTPEFKKELKRRIHILEEGRIDEFLDKNEVESVEAYIEDLNQYIPRKKNTLVY